MIKYINLLLFAGMIVMNYLANSLPLNGKTTGQLSDMYPNLFVPAGITFSIWGVIYMLLLAYCILQFTGSNQVAVTSIGLLFAGTCILNGLWIVAWHYQKLPLSLVIMLCLLVLLIMINIRISNLNYGLIKAAFGVYLGWICIATIANVTTLLVNYNWNRFGIPDEIWTIIMIGAGTLIVALSIFNLRNPYLGLAVLWAFAGIIIKRQADYRSIVLTAAVAMTIVAAVTALGFFRKLT
ncbi:MAG TPA: tryptophan-rich sensory protein [Bacteroidales bacterium]|nr:tryptophan-rich sensory protein [Bacteroidales bacterium]